MTRQHLINAYDISLEFLDDARKDVARKMKAIAKNCQHERTEPIKEADDNGYGRWWYTHYELCKFCGHKERTGRSDYR